MQMGAKFIETERPLRFRLSAWIQSDWQEKGKSTKEKMESEHPRKLEKIWVFYTMIIQTVSTVSL